nr:transporter substrate-binding domain-containing protein [Hydrococcus sp. Prado102]
GAVPNTTNEAVIRMQQPQAELVAVKDRQDGLQKLEKGEIDGFVGDGIVLQGLRKTATNPNNYEIVPEYPYMYESYACLLPQDESAWRDSVNYSLVKFMGGIVSDRQESVAIYEKWFGENSTTPYSRETINDYFQGIVNTYEWIPDVEY